MGKLIRLELFNFKSYKGHHTLLFGDSYFTSIIGPNGSGKSNSMDAISFVLGIKSSHLRSQHLRDLIYRGRVLKTSKINADGTATDGPADGEPNSHVNGDAHADGEETKSSQRNDPQTAWVIAVYEDDAGDLVKWKRSITGAGVSEYRIDNKVVNAKEYNAALEAENILIKARNFLVFQGDVETIASQSPKELTRLIEQISGSLEYKAEYDRLKLESERLAEEQGFKLNQRRGINAEIKQYQEQKKEAENYERKAAERDGAVVRHVLWKLYHFQRVMEESGAEIQKYQEELKEYRRGVEKYERKLEEAKQDQAKVTRDIQKVDRSIKRKEREIEEKENSLIPVDEKVTIANKNLQRYQARVNEISKEGDSQSQYVDKLKKDLGTIQKAQKRWEDERKKIAQQEGRELSEQDLQAYNKLRGEVTKRSAQNQIRIDNISRQLKTDEETLSSLQSKVEAAGASMGKLKNEIEDLQGRKDTLNKDAKHIQKDIDTKRKTINALTSERLRTAQKHTELNEKLQDVLIKLNEADNGRRQNEKELRIKETVAALKRVYPDVRGRIHELCKPKQKKFEIAVSTVLGRHFDAIVTDTEKTAKDCIQYLRDQRIAPLSFIPLETIQFKSINPNLKGMHRGMRLAIDTIDFDREVERAMSYACGNAMVCDDMKVAKYICYEKGVEAKAVTLDGMIIHKGGLMTGGRGPSDRNQRRWEDTEVQNLRKLQEKLIGDLDALPRDRRREAEEETLHAELRALEQKFNYILDELKALDRNIQSKKQEYDFAKSQLDEVNPKYEEQSRGVQNMKTNLKNYQDAVAEVEDDVFRDFCHRLNFSTIREYEDQQGSVQQQNAMKKLEFATQRSKLENQLSFETQRLGQTKDRIKALQEQAKRDEILIAQLQAEKKDIQEDLDVLNAELEQLNEQLEQLKARAGEKGEKVAENRREVQKRGKNVDSTIRAVSELESEVQRNNAARYQLLKKCKIDEIKLPLTQGSRKLESLPLDEMASAVGEDTMDIDAENDIERILPVNSDVQDYGIEMNFDELDDDLKEDSSPAAETKLLDAINTLNVTLEKLSPNMRAIERLETTSTRLKATERDFETARKAAKAAKDEFEDTKEKRLELFTKAFSHISETIGQVYKDLTRSTAFPLGGQAYLDTEDPELPFEAGIKYHAMPPLKRFRDMEHLSGGEKTIAALALLFSIHSFQPSPFFVLDEVDAALDNVNVARVAKYVKDHAGPGMQFIVISLKAALFQESECLVGVLRDQGVNSSRTVTLDLRGYQQDIPVR